MSATEESNASIGLRFIISRLFNDVLNETDIKQSDKKEILKHFGTKLLELANLVRAEGGK